MDSDRKAELDDALLESLLREALTSDHHEQQRIATMLTKLNPATIVEPLSPTDPFPATTIESSPATIPRVGLRRTIVTLAIAASIMIAIVSAFSFVNSGNTAYAAVMRSLAAVPPTRKYVVEMTHRLPLMGDTTSTAELYLDDTNHFVVHHPGWKGLGEIWIGGSPDERWIVPRIGPAFIGGEPVVGGWLAKRGIPSPYLHVSTILERLSRAYKLELLPNENIKDATGTTNSACQRISGTLEKNAERLPAKIELWADVETGVARRVVLHWDRNLDESGPVQWTIELAGSPDLPDNWFRIEGHLNPARRIVNISDPTELDEIKPGPEP